MKTILYVDDDYNSLLLVKEQLKIIDPDIKIITESRGEDGIDTFKNYSEDIDMVIADIQIPNVNGYDLLLLVKKMKPNTPVVMITANNIMRENDYVIKKLGASEYLIKPMSLKLLSEIVDKY